MQVFTFYLSQIQNRGDGKAKNPGKGRNKKRFSLFIDIINKEIEEICQEIKDKTIFF